MTIFRSCRKILSSRTAAQCARLRGFHGLVGVSGPAPRWQGSQAGGSAVEKWKDKLASTHEAMNADGVRGLYNEWVGNYDECVQSWGYNAPDRVVELLWKHCDDKSGDTAARVFDMGCGTGLIGDSIAQSERPSSLPNPVLIGGDFSQDSLDVLQSKRAGKYAEAVLFDLNAFPYSFETNGFDALLCCGVLTYAEDIGRIWREMVRITRPGALLIVTHRSEKMAHDFETIASLMQEGLLAEVERIEKQPYLPLNPNYADQILIDYLIVRNKK